jgi:hypothetical protein
MFRKGAVMTNGKQATLEEVQEELGIANRLMIVSLIRGGIQQKDVAGAVGVSEGSLSKMFPKGLLKRVARSAKAEIES